MPQKQPPATTAVCSFLVVAIGRSTDAAGMRLLFLSAALEVATPPKVAIASTAKIQDRRRDITHLKLYFRVSVIIRALLKEKVSGPSPPSAVPNMQLLR